MSTDVEFGTANIVVEEKEYDKIMSNGLFVAIAAVFVVFALYLIYSLKKNKSVKMGDGF